MFDIRKHLLACAAAAAGLMAAPALAGVVTLSGSFTSDDEVQLLAFRTSAAGQVTIESFGYAGGTDAAGVAVAAGGFDPVLALFSLDGTLLAYGDDDTPRADPVTGAALDARLSLSLIAGTYFVAISQFDNFAIGPDFAAGFLQAGTGSFTAAYGCAAGQFCDLDGSDRSGRFHLSVSGGTVPEPATLALVGLVLPGVWLSRRRQQARPTAGPVHPG